MRLAVAGGDPRAQAAVLAERDDDRAVRAAATAAVASVEPSSITSTSASGSPARSSSSTPGSARSSFQAGMKTTVSWSGTAGAYWREIAGLTAPAAPQAAAFRDLPRRRRGSERGIRFCGFPLANKVESPGTTTKGENAVSGIDAKSDAIYELVEEGSAVEQLATGFTFTEGPIWHPAEQVLYFSDMPGDVRRKVTLDGTVTEVRRPVVQVQRDDARRRTSTCSSAST